MTTIKKNREDIQLSKWNEHKSTFIKEALNLGPTYSYLMLHSPRTMLFTYSRYKFAAKLIGDSPKKTVLDMGCNEGIGTILLKEKGHTVTGVDFDEDAIKWAKMNLADKADIQFKHDDFINKYYGNFDFIVMVDVIEHILKENETDLFNTIMNNLNENGCCIIGTPNISSVPYSSPSSQAGHVNMYSPERLRDAMYQYFNNVFLFGMNDEVVHTGFYPMCQYIFCLGSNPKKKD